MVKDADAYKEYMKRTGEASTMVIFIRVFIRAGSTALLQLQKN